MSSPINLQINTTTIESKKRDSRNASTCEILCCREFTDDWVLVLIKNNTYVQFC